MKSKDEYDMHNQAVKRTAEKPATAYLCVSVIEVSQPLWQQEHHHQGVNE